MQGKQAMAVRDPWRYRVVVDATLFVFALRLIQRAVYAQDIHAAFGIPLGQHWVRTLYFLVIAALLLVARLTLRAGPDEPAVVGRFEASRV